MILPIKFLWEQLDGPQANAIEQAIYEYWKQMFDGKLDYLNNIDIENANDAHLTLLGIIANFIRPNILVPDKDYFLFTEHAESDNPHGLSFVNNRAVGGRLTAISGPEQGPYPLDTEFYRTLLKTYRDSDGEIDSLVLLDDICNALSLKDNPMVQPSYEFSFTKTTTEVTGRGPGDLYIDMGSMSHWANPLQIYAVLTGLANSVFWPLPRIWTSLDTDIRTHTPSPNIQGGTYGEPITIELSCSTAGASIIYTLDGSEPFQDTGLTYTGPIEITDTTLLRVRAYKAELEPSFEFSAQYIISTNIQLPEVMSSVASGLYTGDMTVELNCPFGLPTVIRYTLDGTEPTESSPEYTGPLATTGNMLLKAKAFRGTSYLPSDTTTYDIRVMPQSVVIGPDIWTQAPLVTLTCATEGVTILYSTDGNAPRTEYTEPFYLYETTTIKAIATKAGYTDSVLSEKVFSITSVQPIQSSLPAGGYMGAQSVILYCATPSAIIRYTLDGTEPTEASTEYVGPITIMEGVVVIKAKAWKGELAPSLSEFRYCIRKTPIVAFGDSIYASTDGLHYTEVLTGSEVFTLTDESTIEGTRIKSFDLVQIDEGDPDNLISCYWILSIITADGVVHLYKEATGNTSWTEGWTVFPSADQGDARLESLYFRGNIGETGGCFQGTPLWGKSNSSSVANYVTDWNSLNTYFSITGDVDDVPQRLGTYGSSPVKLVGMNGHKLYYTPLGPSASWNEVSTLSYQKDVSFLVMDAVNQAALFGSVSGITRWVYGSSTIDIVLEPTGPDILRTGVASLTFNRYEHIFVVLTRAAELFYSTDGITWTSLGNLPRTAEIPEDYIAFPDSLVYDAQQDAYVGACTYVDTDHDNPMQVAFRITNIEDMTTFEYAIATEGFASRGLKCIDINIASIK